MQYMQNIYRDDIIDNSICRKWYGKFGNGNFHLKDISYTGRPIITDSDKINTLIDYYHLITWDINQTLNISVSKYIYIRDLELFSILEHCINWVKKI